MVSCGVLSAPAAADAPEEPLVWCSVNIRTRVYHETAPGQLDDSLKSLKLGYEQWLILLERALLLCAA